MSVLALELFLAQPYRYCPYLGRIQAPYADLFKTDDSGFRVSLKETGLVDLASFTGSLQPLKKILVIGNSVGYGVPILQDEAVIHNLFNVRPHLISFNGSLRASTAFQDSFIFSRIAPLDLDALVWIGGLNDLLAVILGTYHHHLFPPFIGESRVELHGISAHPLELNLEERLELLSSALCSVLAKAALVCPVCFIWQPLFSGLNRALTERETKCVDAFFHAHQGSLGALYKSVELPSVFKHLCQLIEKKTEQAVLMAPAIHPIRFLDSNLILPPDSLEDVTHVNAAGHQSMAHASLSLLNLA